MRSRMGAGYAKEFDELRKKGFTLQQIVDYFLKRDEETISESRLVAKLKAEARVDSRVYLKREYSKEKWGVSLTYTYRYLAAEKALTKLFSFLAAKTTVSI